MEKENVDELNFPCENCIAFSQWFTTLQLQSLEFPSQFVKWKAVIPTLIIVALFPFIYLSPIGALT